MREIHVTDIDRHRSRPASGPEPTTEVVSQTPPSETETRRAAAPAGPTSPVALKVALLIGVAWVAGISWMMSISPAVPDTAPPPTALDVLVQTAMLVSWLAVLAGVVTRQRFLFGASIAGGAVLAGAGLLCLATGHTGLWIPAQIGTGIGLAGLGYGASRVG